MDRCLHIQRHTQLGSHQAAQWFNPLYTNNGVMNELGGFHSSLILSFSKTHGGNVLVLCRTETLLLYYVAKQSRALSKFKLEE